MFQKSAFTSIHLHVNNFGPKFDDKVNFQTDVILQKPEQKRSPYTYLMEDNLNVICQFADIITNTLRRFVELCKQEKRRRQSGISEFSELQSELIKQRKKRMELEEMVRRVGSSGSDPTLNDILNSYQERKRPRTAFTLFLADYREKIMRDNPNFALPKVVNIAKIKWKMLSREDQEAYEKKLQAINRYCMERDINSGNATPTGDQNAVKRQFGCEEEMERENEGNQDNNIGPEYSRHNNGYTNQEHNHESAYNNEANGIQNTMIASMAEEQLIPKGQQAPREKSAIENILDLFHTQQNNTTGDPQSHHIALNEVSLAQQPINDPPSVIPSAVDNPPSLVMIDPATATHPLVIPPTIQE